MRIDEKREGVLVVTFTAGSVYWWQADGNVGVTYPWENGEPNPMSRRHSGDDEVWTATPPDRTTGPVTLRFRADESNRLPAISAAHRLALAVLCGDDEGARILADMVLLGDAK